MSKRLIGITGWIRDINNTWAEQFDVRDMDGAPCLMALGSREKAKTLLIAVSDVDKLFAERERPEEEDQWSRANQVTRLILQALPGAIKHNEFIKLEDLLDNAVREYCWANPYPTFDMICAKGPVEPFDIEE